MNKSVKPGKYLHKSAEINDLLDRARINLADFSFLGECFNMVYNITCSFPVRRKDRYLA